MPVTKTEAARSARQKKHVASSYSCAPFERASRAGSGLITSPVLSPGSYQSTASNRFISNRTELAKIGTSPVPFYVTTRNRRQLPLLANFLFLIDGRWTSAGISGFFSFDPGRVAFILTCRPLVQSHKTLVVVWLVMNGWVIQMSCKEESVKIVGHLRSCSTKRMPLIGRRWATSWDNDVDNRAETATWHVLIG